MFSSLFGKRRSSPIEDETPPIPGPRSDEGFEIVSPVAPNRGGMYPNIGGGGTGTASPYPQRPAPPTPAPAPAFRPVDHTFHYLQGVPFSMCKELQMASNKDAVATEIGDLLSYAISKMNTSAYNYDFNVERSVLKEC